MSHPSQGPLGTADPVGGAPGGGGSSARLRADDEGRPPRWLPVAVLLVLALAAGVLLLLVRGVGDGGDPAPAPSPTSTGTAPSSDDGRLTRADWEGTEVGVFRQTDADEVADYEEWLGRPVTLAVDFSARDTWDDIANPGYLFEEWDGTGRRLVLGVAMLPSEVDDVSVEAGAEGAYDEHFHRLAENLVEAGQEDAILRVGWEFNLDSWRWATEDEEAWIAYYRNIVEAMDAVEGSAFRYDWNPNNGGGPVDAVDYYPGNDYVDYIGIDTYDVSGQHYPIDEDCTGSCALEVHREAWDERIHGGSEGLQFWSEFARGNDKQMSLPEWGIWDRNDGTGGGDNAFFIEQMADFIEDEDNAVGYQAYFENNNAQGRHRLMTGDFPASEEAYLERFGG